MAEETKVKKEVIINKWHGGGSGGGAIYFFGLIGALVYYLQSATNFTEGLIGVFKSIGWPGMIVFEILKLLKL